jgi:tight adherence protein C
MIFVIAGIALNRQLRHDTVLAARVRGVQRSGGIENEIASTGTSQSRLLSLVAGVGEAITQAGLLSASTLDELQLRLSTAGFRGRNALAAFIGAKLLALGGLPLVCWIAVSRTAWSPTIRFAAIAGAGVVGLLLPDYVVRSLHKRHMKSVERGLPDALDMLVICSEAGLGLEPAIERVGREIGHAHQAVADELLNVAREMRVNADRRAALINMGKRTGLASLQRLGVTLIQTLQYGTPLSQALRTLSAEMRQEALTRFEARAGRLPSLLTVPMIVFILPCVFLIVGGPAVVHVMQLMH